MSSITNTALYRSLHPQAVPIVDISDFFSYLGYKYQVHMVLDYLNHEKISGNKLRKLLYPLDTILQSDIQSIASFGGYFSNHLSALAWAGNALGFKTLGYINGEKPRFLGYTLRFLEEMKMELTYLSRKEFKQLREEREGKLSTKDQTIIIPLGGKSAEAILGFQNFVEDINKSSAIHYDQWWISYGTGTSALAIANYLRDDQYIYAQGAVMEEVFTDGEVEELGLSPAILDKITSAPDKYFKGIGKTDAKLIELLYDFYKQTGIPLDPIYTGKLVYSFLQYLSEGKGNSNSNYLLIHSGGIQGINGFNEMNKTTLPFTTDIEKVEQRTLFQI